MPIHYEYGLYLNAAICFLMCGLLYIYQWTRLPKVCLQPGYLPRRNGDDPPPHAAAITSSACILAMPHSRTIWYCRPTLT